MNLCSDGHEEICHEGRQCPVCELISDHQKEIKKLENNLEKSEDENSSLRDEIENLKN